MGEAHLTSQNAIVEDRDLTEAGAPHSRQGTGWADGLELLGDDDRLVGFAGALPLPLLAEQAGPRAGLSAAMARRGFDPVHDRGQILIDLAVAQILGGEAISDFQGLRHLAPATGPVAPNPTVWRALSEVGALQLTRINSAVTGFRRHWWKLLAARPEGFRGLSRLPAQTPDVTMPLTVLRQGHCTAPAAGSRRRRCCQRCGQHRQTTKRPRRDHRRHFATADGASSLPTASNGSAAAISMARQSAGQDRTATLPARLHQCPDHTTG
ncbi:MAG: hypothetical protein LH603_05740 [Pseudonocardia sp.]|nr:hypothetical protein [Pseudonocardia sp.]